MLHVVCFLSAIIYKSLKTLMNFSSENIDTNNLISF